jgi:predicted Zn finger-like uncharacterized protein
MQVVCPYCSTPYVLPDHLMGPGGARVRCPNCREQFVVPPGGEPVPLRVHDPEPAVAEAPPAEPAGAATPHEPGSRDERPEPANEEELAALRRRFERPEAEEPAPAAVAPPPPPPPPAEPAPEVLVHALLDELERGEGEALAQSRAAGRVFADFGPRILAAWDEYRRRAGTAADVQVFRAALRARWGVDLEPPGAGGPAT